MKKSALLLIILVFAAVSAIAQTSSFTYQGKLTDGGAAANGQYDLSFKLYASNGAQIGSDVTVEDVQVTAGIFTVNLNFGSSPFTSNAATLLEIAVRPGAGTGAYTTLAPRQPITSSPYAVQTIRAASAAVADNANQLGGIPASEYVQTNDSRLSDDRNPLPNSPNYIQNIPGIGQQTASFNISGGGTASIFNATTQYNIGGNRMLSAPGAFNTFVGLNTGPTNTGFRNSFFGFDAGYSNTTGQQNSFFGLAAGRSNTEGTGNSFFGDDAGRNNNTGFQNSFFGQGAGAVNGTGFQNSFLGTGAGIRNTSGRENSFVGFEAGLFNTTGNTNSFFGSFAGGTNATGANNTMIGWRADVLSNSLSNATAIGANAIVSQSNSMVLGNGVNVGIGTSAPEQKLHVVGNEILSTGTQGGFKFRNRGSTSSNDDWVWYSDTNIARFFRAGTGDLLTVQTNGNVGMGVPVPTFKLHVSDSSNTGLRVQTNTAGGTVASFGGTGAFQIDAPGIAGGRLNVAENGNVSIRGEFKIVDPFDSAGHFKVTSGRVYIPRQLGGGLVLRSSDLTCWAISIGNNGLFLPAEAIPCP